mmetsp:Transcript_81095/g.235261  ORF Transcript_81095/g.235261 Transcript_81095/m.235261 type:complete len:235 (+) Transcript_81095:59-763(+)
MWACCGCATESGLTVEEQVGQPSDFVMAEPIPVAGGMGGCRDPGDVETNWDSPKVFSAPITRTAGARLGLELDLADKVTACVVKVGEGVVHDFNAAARGTEKPRIQPCDRIAAVNGVRGSAEDIFNRLQSDTHLTLEIHRPQCIMLSIPDGEGSLGVKVIYGATGSTLFVTGILPGRVHEFNRASAGKEERELRLSDRIFRVNHIQGDQHGAQALLEELKRPGRKELLIHRSNS